MSEQILLQGKILGIEEFLLSPAGADEDAPDVLAGRAQWISLLCDVLPRALLAELGLARILLGSSGGGQFLVVLPGEARETAEQFLAAAARQALDLSSGHVRLIWGVTDNLGDWAVIRRRITDALDTQRWAPLADSAKDAFAPFQPERSDADTYFAKELGAKVREASRIGWSPENPGRILVGAGK